MKQYLLLVWFKELHVQSSSAVFKKQHTDCNKEQFNFQSNLFKTD